ncbi:LCP family protein [Actinacidiphila paucisporea]|uniref:Transcriptional attenuator, LytR family n=1 Tax=Actinacidiphila paucisporea TaxID=310782 RepID=A0A1M7FAD7_9ACTN|nr:LCP family protein [Actinacidiphila paucisporea]SHM00718.1 transcriptional attenuator, LytR family [Actinacidiphila paucisporea]
MRDGATGGQDAASNHGEYGWDEGLYRDDARAYAPQGTDYGSAQVPGPRSPHGSGDGPEPIPGGPGAGGADSGPAGHGGGRGRGHAAGQGSGHRRGGPRRQRSRKRKVLRWVAIVAAVGVLGTAGAAYGYYEYLSGKIRKGERVSGKTTVAKPKANANGSTAMNILILGSDSRLSADDQKLGGAADSEGARADVIMIAHLSADRSNMSVVSIPRDTRVDIPECEDPKTHHVYPKYNSIINASLGRGGPGCTLATVQNLTNVYIDHWLMIDFSGVVKMADVLGGVEVCVQHSVWDRPTKYIAHGGSGLKLPKGKSIIKDKQALQWLRTRDAFGDDSGRAKAQHMYMSSLIRTLRGQNLFTSPARLNKIATTAMGAFAFSSEIGTPKKLYDLGMELKSISPSRMTMLTMPHDADPKDPKAHYIPSADASTVWSLLRNDVPMDAGGKAKVPGAASASPTPSTTTGPPAAAPATIPVTVVNGTAGTAGNQAVGHRATAIATALKTAGFTKAEPSQTAVPSPGTSVVYPAASGDQGKADAASVAKALKIPLSNVKPSTTAQAITLTVGADWKQGTDYSSTLPKAGGVPKTADVVNGADTTGCMPIQPIYRWAG